MILCQTQKGRHRVSQALGIAAAICVIAIILFTFSVWICPSGFDCCRWGGGSWWTVLVCTVILVLIAFVNN